MLALFTAAESVILGQVCMFYPHETVLIAAGVTTAIVIGLTIFAFQTKIDFTMCGGILACVLFVFLLFGLLMAILPLMGVNIELLHLVYCGIGVLIFSIYLNILNIFLYILRIVGAAKK